MRVFTVAIAVLCVVLLCLAALADSASETAPVAGLSPVVVTTGINAIAVLSGVGALLSRILPLVARGVLALERISQNTEATRDGVDALLRSRGVGAEARRKTTRTAHPKEPDSPL